MTLTGEGAPQLNIFQPHLWGLDGRKVRVACSGGDARAQPAIISAHAGGERQTLYSKGLLRSVLVYVRYGTGQLLPLRRSSQATR